MYANTILALCGLASVASAHMKMNKPVPYGASSLDNSPLDKTGSDFPCKQRSGVYDAQGASNVYALGSSGTLAFTGQATHGGGSCQVSITYDANPTKNSVFKVIQSIEGGCPAKDQTGNMGGDANALDPYTYGFKIPDNIPAGNGTIVWTWFNKVGNREMYMNCGPLTLTGTGGSKSNFDALPDMFTANIGNGCSTPDSTDLVFPNPGAAVDQFNGATTAWGTPQGTCQTAGPAASPAAGSNTPTTAAAQPTAPAASVPGGVFVTVPVASDTPAATPSATADPSPVATSAAAKSPSPAVTPTPIASPAPAASSSPSSGTGSTGAMTAGTACSTEGSWNCVGGSQYQRCASGMWSVLMPLAAGTSCTPGQSANINMVVTRQGKKRTLRFRSF